MGYMRLHMPAPELQRFIKGYLFSRTTIHDRLFPAWTQNFLFLHLGDVYSAVMANGDVQPGFPEMLVGPRSYPSRLRPVPCYNRSIVLEFRPTAFFLLAHGGPAAFSNSIVNAQDYLPRISEIRKEAADSKSEIRACESLNRYFNAYFRNADATIPENKKRILDTLDRQSDFREIQKELDALPLSVRHLRQLFAEVTGLSPYLYLRIRRMEQMLAEFHQNPDIKYLTRIYDFYDQSHFIREFRRFTGMRPLQFLDDMKKEEERTLHYNLALHFFDPE